MNRVPKNNSYIIMIPVLKINENSVYLKIILVVEVYLKSI